jgi:hypothetical protein
MMTRRERLMATLQGKTVDRPPVSFYEINGLDEDPYDQDPFNIYNDPSWLPLIELATEKTDRIVQYQIPQFKASGDKFSADDISMVGVPFNPLAEFTKSKRWLDENGRRFIRNTIKVRDKILTSTTRQDPDVNTVWFEEPLLKNTDDLKTFLKLPRIEYTYEPDISGFLEAEKALGDSGIVMIDTPDPLCLAAELFDLGTYTIIALMESELFHQLLERFSTYLQKKTELVGRMLPGRLWRIYGPEFASSPHLPPHLFREYVVKYDTPMVNVIHNYGGYARLHSHGNLKNILDDIVSTGCMGLDPIEPPPQGDVSLSYVRENYGKDLVLFGNLEASDIENLTADQMEKKTIQAIEEGTEGEGKGFVLTPSSCPYGRKLSKTALTNYETIINVVEKVF